MCVWGRQQGEHIAFGLHFTSCGMVWDLPYSVPGFEENELRSSISLRFIEMGHGGIIVLVVAYMVMALAVRSFLIGVSLAVAG